MYDTLLKEHYSKPDQLTEEQKKLKKLMKVIITTATSIFISLHEEYTVNEVISCTQQHEHRSAKMVELLLKELRETEKADKFFKKPSPDWERDLKFIQKLITFDKDLKDNPDLMKVWSN